MKQLSIICINYNSSRHLLHLIKSTTHIKNAIKETIIIDNNSKDKYLLELITDKKVKIIRNDSNVGFSKAVNQAICISKSEYILLINPDCIIPDNSINKSFQYLLEHKNVGVIGGKIIDSQNNLTFTANNKPTLGTMLFEFTNLKKIFPNNKFTKQFWPEKNNIFNTPTPVSSLCGAFILFRKKSKSGDLLFNEKYFLYLEDVSFGLSVNKMGMKVMFDPRSHIIHLGGKSNNSKYKILLKYWYRSRKILLKEVVSEPLSCIISLLYTLEEKFLAYYHKIKHEPTE